MTILIVEGRRSRIVSYSSYLFNGIVMTWRGPSPLQVRVISQGNPPPPGKWWLWVKLFNSKDFSFKDTMTQSYSFRKRLIIKLPNFIMEIQLETILEFFLKRRSYVLSFLIHHLFGLRMIVWEWSQKPYRPERRYRGIDLNILIYLQIGTVAGWSKHPPLVLKGPGSKRSSTAGL